MLPYWGISRLIGSSRTVYACSTFTAPLGPPSQPRVLFCDTQFEFRAQLKFLKHYAVPLIESSPSIYACHILSSRFGPTAWPRLVFSRNLIRFSNPAPICHTLSRPRHRELPRHIYMSGGTGIVSLAPAAACVLWSKYWLSNSAKIL